MHIRTKSKSFNADLKKAIGYLYDRHVATITREEAATVLYHVGDMGPKQCVAYEQAMWKSAELQDECKRLAQSCQTKRTLGGS